MPGAWNHAEAREAGSLAIDIPPGDLRDALIDLARIARVSIGADGALPRIRVSRLHGEMTVAQALERLLAGTGYHARRVGETAWRIERAPAPRKPQAVRAPLPTTPPPPLPQETIVVTATKQPLDLMSLPTPVAILDALQLPARGAALSATPEVAARIDGLALTALGPGRNRMFLRGVADSAFGGESQSTVAVVLDEARLTYAAPDPDIRLVDMDRIEVLKGPQGSLYGTGALGGIYRMVAHRADLDSTELSLAAGGSGVSEGSIGYSGSAVANLRIVPGYAALRLVGYTGLEPGWIDSGSDGTRRHDGNSTRVSGARGQFGLEPAAGWRLDLTGMAQWLNSRDSRYTYAARRYDRPAQLAEPHDNDLVHAAARLHGDLSGVDVMLSSGMTWHEVADAFDATVGADGFGIADPRMLKDRRTYRVWDTELRLRGQWGAAQWLLGFSHLDANQSLETRLIDGLGTSTTLDRPRRDSHDTAAYLDLAIPLTGTVSVNGGGRLYRSSVADTLFASGARGSSERDRTGFTPQVAVRWKPDTRNLVYLRYGSAFRQGASGLGRGTVTGRLAGDELASIEAGWRLELKGSGRLEMAVWYARWNHVQSDTLSQNGLIGTIDAGDAGIVGLETSLAWPVREGWKVEAGGNLTDARLTRNALGYELHDTRLPVVPDYTLRAALSHEFELAGLPASARFDLRYLGPARMSFEPDLDRRMGKVLESGIEVDVSSGNWLWGVSARNLFGAKGDAFAFGNPLRYRLSQQHVQQLPRTILLNASLKL